MDFLELKITGLFQSKK